MSATKILSFPVGPSLRKKVNGPAHIIQFPTQHSCPTCGRACAPDELSECLTCGQQYCSRKECDWTCACDRFAVEMVGRALCQSEK